MDLEAAGLPVEGVEETVDGVIEYEQKAANEETRLPEFTFSDCCIIIERR
jgi:hypothetical protein